MGDSVRRIHQEDFCQILGYLPSRKYQADGGPRLADLADEVRELSVRPAADILQFVRWVVFCAIGGNADGHAKNLSVIYDEAGLMLAPAYDLVCTRAYPRLHRNLAFSVGGVRDPDRIQQDNWKRFADAVGVRPRLVFREVERLVDQAEEAFDRASDQLVEQVGESHAIQHVSKAVMKRVRAIRSHI